MFFCDFSQTSVVQALGTTKKYMVAHPHCLTIMKAKLGDYLPCATKELIHYDPGHLSNFLQIVYWF
jgi:hypothetical protein